MRNMMLGLVMASMLASPALGQSFVGEWTATAHSPEGNFSERLIVNNTDSGYSIEAKLIGPPPGTPEAGPATEISLDGDTFSFKRLVGDSIVIVYSGVVSGDEFVGVVEIAGFPIPYTGVRSKSEQR